MDGNEPVISPGPVDLVDLQRRVLVAALEESALDGSDVPVHLPDRAWVVVGGRLQLSRDGLAGPDVLAGLEPSVELLDADPGTPAPAAYARLHADVLGIGEVQITLESRLASGGVAPGATSTSAVTVTFGRIGSGWRPTSGPVQSAG